MGKRVTIITGAPGAGKSCFVWNLARKWKLKELFKQYELAILVRLNDGYVRQAKKIVDLIQYEIQELREQTNNWIITNNGKGCLFMFDGFDELPVDLQRNSIIKQMISGEILGEASLIVTTRSAAAKRLHNICKGRVYQHLEILGFDKQHIDNYILSAFNTDAFRFHNYLQCYPNIRSFMCIPLHCAIVVQSFNSQQSKKQAPKTMTELYTTAVKIVIVRSLQSDYPDLADKELDNLTDLPDEVKQYLETLAKKAYDCIQADELFFNGISKHIKTLGTLNLNYTSNFITCIDISKPVENFIILFSHVSHTLMTLSYFADLLEEQPDIYDPLSHSVSYNFVHKTVQEYLAAYHLSKQPLDKQLTILQKMLSTSKMAIVLKFVAGLVNFSHLVEIYNDFFNTDDIHALVQYIHCLFETQDPVSIAKALEKKRTFDFTLQPLSPLDCYAMNYCVVVSKVQIDLRLESSNISDEALTMLLQPIADDKCIFCYVKELVVTNVALKSRITSICKFCPLITGCLLAFHILRLKHYKFKYASSISASELGVLCNNSCQIAYVINVYSIR